MLKTVPRVLVAGTHSGCGKTTVTCALLAALKARQLGVGAFKCGPDYIDPMFHREAIGITSHNLDPFFCEENLLRQLLTAGAGGDISVIEGVMGYYDGIGLTHRASTFEVASITETPVILVVNAKGMGNSVCALLKGFTEYFANSRIKGVIFNGISGPMYKALSESIASFDLIPLGYLPHRPELAIESRHLGLITAAEIPDIRAKLDKLAALAAETLDIDGILRLAAAAPDVRSSEELAGFGSQSSLISSSSPSSQDNLSGQSSPSSLSSPGSPGKSVTQGTRNSRRPRIAVARDEAFCFIYTENIELLQTMGCDIAYFSPLRDKALPAGSTGLYLCGGYPELHSQALSANIELLADLRRQIQSGLPTIAECGGFMYLHEQLDGNPMAAVIAGNAFKTGSLQRFGYITLTAGADNLLLAAGESVRAHEFHYWDSGNPGAGFQAAKAGSAKAWPCVHATETLYAGFPHLYFYANPAMAERFVEAAGHYAAGR
ncbi:MAG: cobyrinate a,c-diamide synthase [Clostridiales bacterium]